MRANPTRAMRHSTCKHLLFPVLECTIKRDGGRYFPEVDEWGLWCPRCEQTVENWEVEEVEL